MSILMILTSNDRLGDTGKKTGVWFEEFATPYYIFRDEGAKVVLASPRGGRPPIDPRSEEEQAQTDSTKRFLKDKEAQQAFASTVQLSAIIPKDHDAVFYPGGHGPLWDLAEDAELDQDCRSALRGRKAGRSGMSWAGRVPPYEIGWMARLSYKGSR